MLRMMTSDPIVVDASRSFLPWLLLMPPIGCAAFTWDGIYIGATASKAIRNSMLWAVLAFGLTWAAGNVLLDCSVIVNVASAEADNMAMHVLMAAYFAHLLARTIYLSVFFLTFVRVSSGPVTDNTYEK